MRTPQPALSVTYQQIHQALVHGDLGGAMEKAGKAQAAFSSDPSWAMKLRLLQAEILAYQGLAHPVIDLLACNTLSFPASVETAIKRDILCAQEQAALGHVGLSDREMEEARLLSTSTHSSLAGELLRTEALIADEYKHQPEGSIALYRSSMQAARAAGDTFLEAGDLLDLGMVALERAHYDEALDLFSQSSALAEKIQARQVFQAALGNSGQAYFNLGDFMRALSTFEQAEREALAAGIVSDQLTWLWDEGISYYKLGKTAEAEVCYRNALELARSIHDYDALAGLNTDLGLLLYGKGQYTLALACSNDAIQAAKSTGNRSAATEPLFLQALLATHQPDTQAAETSLLDVHTKSATDAEIYPATELALASFYNHHGQRKNADLWFRKAVQTFEAQREAVKVEELKLPFFANGESIYRDYATFLIDTHRPDEALNLLDQGRARTLSDGLGQSIHRTHRSHARSLEAPKIAKGLNATLLFYALGPDTSYLWAIDSRQTRLFTLPKASELETAVQSYNRSLIQSSDPLRQPSDSATFLYQSLIAPAASMLPPGARVIIIADGVLNQLNFETLVVPGTKSVHYWIEDVTLSNASSIRMLARGAAGRPSATRDNLLLIGNPLTSGTGFDPLPHASAEVHSVAGHFPPTARTIVDESAAVPSSYVANTPEHFTYIHFVAHGTASLLSPLDSAVILSPTPRHPETYKLYARDIVRQPIHAQLVTISACNGSGLRAYAGEGLVGLSWAFLRAGAHNVIGALWQVDDAATPLIMDRLYTDLRVHHTSPDTALRSAKLALIHSPGVYRKPLYWGAFQLYTGS